MLSWGSHSMRVSLLCFLLAFVQGCKHLALGIPFQIKAAIEGEVKGVKILCEKTLELDRGEWGVMCRAGNNIDVKYRMQRFNDEQTKVEFLVAKEKNGEQKLIAAPVMIVKDRHPSSSESATHNSNVLIKAERVK
jgi:hypothetical protein